MCSYLQTQRCHLYGLQCMFVITSNKEFCAFFVSFQQTNSISVSLKGVSSALRVLFVLITFFIVQWKQKFSCFSSINFNIFLTILKLPVIYHASLHCPLFAKNTKQAAQLTITFLLRAEINQQYERTRFALNHRLSFWKRTSLVGISLAADAERAKLLNNNAVL